MEDMDNGIRTSVSLGWYHLISNIIVEYEDTWIKVIDIETSNPTINV
jgi:hypothetical protein